MSGSSLAQGRLGAWGIVFFVVSAAAPLTVIATTPFSVRVGGIGAPGAYLAAGVVLTLFAIGFTAMTRYVRNAGAFYAYASRGLGRDAGNGVAVMTACCYGVMVTGFYGFIGFYAQLEVQRLLGFDLPWWVAGLGCAVLVGVLGYRQVDVGARVLAVLLTAEVVVLVIFAVAVLVQQRPEPLTVAPLAPSHVFASGAGALFVIGFGSYIGFEGTAIYVEEAKRPERTIPRATYAAIAFLSVFYAFCAWVLVQAWGVTGMLEGAHREGEFYGEMLFVAAEDYAGRGLASSMSLLVVTSFLAAAVAFHNACARYLFAMGRTGLLPARFARTHPRMRSPYVASVTITVVVLAGILVGVLAGADPLQFAFWTYAPGVFGVVAAQAVGALSVVAFFTRDRRGHSPWRVQVAPGLAALGLGVGLYLIGTNFDLISGRTGWVNWLMLLFTPVTFALGVARGRLAAEAGAPAQR
ncbi:APC family permease [Pimelobacter simplex]|uniref:APC family permease n=1 Tax=Nocardioides simplex TaxID=2045 RepID=UPI003AB091E5